VEGPRRTGKGLEDVLENESEENMNRAGVDSTVK